jgi:CYTH domain-containing protein
MTEPVLPWRRTPGRGRYARPERERRFLVRHRPPLSDPPRLIDDRYVDGTQLRLRRLRVGAETVYKLTQKVRADEADPVDVSTTNMYLTAGEHRRLSALPAAELRKRRYVVPAGGQSFVLDVFEGQLRGLLLAEIEVEDRTDNLELPAWFGREVTRDHRYSGGALARAGADEIAALLLEAGC